MSYVYNTMDKTGKGQISIILCLCVLAAGILYVADIDHEYNELVTVQQCWNLYKLNDQDGKAEPTDFVSIRQTCIDAYN